MANQLVVASKVKSLIKEKSGMNTSASAFDALSKKVEEECEKAIRRAKDAKRKTVMEKDFVD